MSKNFFLSLDLGGTSAKAGLVDEHGQIFSHQSISTQSEQEPKKLIEKLIECLHLLANQAPQKPQALAVGVPGWIDKKEGMLIKAPNLSGWRQIPIAKIMEQALEIPVYLENDSNLYALGEWYYGAGQNCKNQIIVTLGTGVGGGLILNNKLWDGSFASAAEIGHMPVVPNGYLCGCGNLGCLETVASATAVRKMAIEWLENGFQSKYEGDPQDIDAKIIYQLALEGDKMSLSIYKKASFFLGIALASVFNLLGLEKAIIGGGMSGAFEIMYPTIWNELVKRVVTGNSNQISLEQSKLGNFASLSGGVALIKERQKKLIEDAKKTQINIELLDSTKFDI